MQLLAFLFSFPVVVTERLQVGQVRLESREMENY